MLESLFINTLTAFSDDYKALCKSHYPTIHNRGMSPAHLSAAFNRRLISLAKCNGSTIGIHNQLSEDNFAAVLETTHSMACVNRSIYHPLESNQQHALLKYFLCFALFKNKKATC